MFRRGPNPRNVTARPRILVAVLALATLLIGVLTPAAASGTVAPVASSGAFGEMSRAAVVGEPVKMTLAGFTAGNIMSDSVFTDESTMTESQIQAFFDSKVSTCRGGSDSWGQIVCLKDYRTDSVDRPADGYCRGYTGAKGESAARIIYRVSQSCDINPRVLIVMLQKEQSLVTHTWPSAWRYDMALGQGCPDDAPCNPAYVGFFHQIYGAARQMQTYLEGRWFTWYAPGNTWNVLYNPNRDCGSGRVYIANAATAALYYYTPYQPNAAALRAGYGAGDACSSYGNRNFYNYFTDWFGPTGAGDVCDVPANVGSAQRQYVATTGLNGRLSPTTACEKGITSVNAASIVQARRVTSDGKWIEAVTLDGPRWLAREYLRYATAEEGECTAPSGTSIAQGDYVVRVETTAKLAPWAACDLNATALRVGTSLEATRISATGNWLEVRTQAGTRWIARSAVVTASPEDIEAACTDPASTTGATGEFVLRSAQVAWLSPIQKCGTGDALPVGTVVQASRLSYTGNWMEVHTHAGMRWVARSSLEAATQADVEAACVAPAGTSPVEGLYVLRIGQLAWPSPLQKCATGEMQPDGLIVQATRVSYSGDWLQVRTSAGARWIPTDSLDLCAQPAATRPATRQYVVREPVDALVSPLSECGTSPTAWGPGVGPRSLGVGTVLQATRVSYSGKWLEVQTSVGDRWIPRDSVDVCPVPSGTRTASKQYVVTQPTQAFVSPFKECGTDAAHWGTGTAPLDLPVGTVLQATRVSYTGNWLEVETPEGRRWIWRADTRVR